MDRRLTPFSGRFALPTLRGQVDAPIVDGEAASIGVALADLCDAPDGARDRQVLFGAQITVIERRGGHVFVQAARDSYCGWVVSAAIGPVQTPTHRVSAAATHIYPAPKVQAREVGWLPFNAQVTVTGVDGHFARTAQGFIPLPHLTPVSTAANDPVAVARQFLGAPYLWGGNTVRGLDCSGLIQLAFHACGYAMAGDSDLQRREGVEVTDPQRGDLVFWKGHVALVAGTDEIIHANGHTMDVSAEGLAQATQRIAAAGGGDLLAIRRVNQRGG